MFTAIHHFRLDHSAHCLRAIPSKILNNHCFQFLLGIIFVPREIEDNGYAENLFGGGGELRGWGGKQGAFWSR